MKLIYRCCAGLDVHKKSVSACIRRRVTGSREVQIEEAVFGTFTQDLKRLCEFLKRNKVKQVAMESTGVYWIPVWNILERSKPALDLTLVNPTVVAALQGRKTDRIDARRITEYLQYGLLRGSFVPPRPTRELRELTRMRTHVQQDRNRVINRIARLLETVNIKLSSVASNIVGKSGRLMLKQLAAGVKNPERLAELALGSLKSKTPDLILALDGRPDEHFRWVLATLLNKLERMDSELAHIDERLEAQMAPHADLLRRLCSLPGVEMTTAQILVAELGTDMNQFPDAAHMASWVGLCPGNAESAGKRFSGRTRKGNRYLRRILVQSAWAAARKKECFLAALFYRIAQRKGAKKAAVAVAHRILTIAYSIIRDGTEYRERGGDHFDRLHPERTARRLVSRLERIGFEVEVKRPVASPPKPPGPPVTDNSCPRCRQMGITDCIHLIKRFKKYALVSPPPADSTQ